MKNKRGICFSGGGVLGIGHAGAVDKLFELECMNGITHVCGSSVGSIMATVIALKATRSYIRDTLFGLRTERFRDGNCFPATVIRLIKNGGLYKGQEINRFVEKIVEDLTGNKDTTLLQAYKISGIHLTITVFSLRYRQTRYIDYITQPHMRIVDAVRGSCNISIFYELYPARMLCPVNKDGVCDKILQDDLLSDGGVTDNIPIHILREQGLTSSEILCLHLMGPEDINKYQSDIDGEMYDYGLPSIPVGMVTSLIDGIRDGAMKVHIHEEDWKLIVKINTGSVKVTDFNLSDDEKNMLYNNGMEAIDKYLVDSQKLLDNGEYPL